MGSSFKIKLFAPLLLSAMASLGLILFNVQQLGIQAKTDQEVVERLFQITEDAHLLLDDIRALDGQEAGNESDSPDSQAAYDSLLFGITTRQSEVSQLTGDAFLSGRVAQLDASVEQWRARYLELIADGDAAFPARMASMKQAQVEVAERVEQLERDAQLQAAELIEGERSIAVAMMLQIALVLVLGAVATLVVLYRMGSDVFARLHELPRRLEREVFDKQQTPDRPTNAGDPVDSLALAFKGFTDKVHAKLRDNEKVERLAFTDPLTGLPNRRGLLSFLDRLADNDEVWEEDRKIGLIHLDLDHFKTINDTMGHDAGDTVLREATKRMSTGIRDSDLLARLGGDEFLVVATGIECEADLTIIADRLLAQFETPITYLHRVCNVGISMGIVLGGQRGRVRDPKRLLINADMALFRAKSEGRGRYAVFTSAMAEEARRQNERSIALGDALHSDAFRPWFQPMIDLETNRVVGLELLARWHDPQRGVLMPHDFLDDAESHSLMEEIGLQVLERALDALRNWRLAELDVPMIHLNLSRTQLLSSSFVDRFSWALDEANIASEQIAVEVDERNCGTRGGEVAMANVNRLKQMGMQVVLDNFGADHASLANIGPLGARCVKISPHTFGRMFGARDGDVQVTVLKALHLAAGALDLSIRANGVETASQSAMFSAAGISVQQGDQLVPVMDVEQTGEYLGSHLVDQIAAFKQVS